MKHPEGIILIHGLASPDWLLEPMSRYFNKEGFDSRIIHYPSRRNDIATNVDFIWNQIKPLIESNQKWHIVGHSLGAIIIQHILSKYKPRNIGQIILLAPPNHGSKVYSFLQSHLPISLYLARINHLPLQFQEEPIAPNICKNYDCHLIAGQVSWTLFGLFLGEPSDGILTVSSTKINGLKSIQIINQEHLFMLFSNETYQSILKILQKKTD